MLWLVMSKAEFVAKMVALEVRYRKGLFPNGAWKQEGSILIAYAGRVLVGQYDDVTGSGWPQCTSASSVYRDPGGFLSIIPPPTRLSVKGGINMKVVNGVM
jgi:hypothetical protein